MRSSAPGHVAIARAPGDLDAARAARSPPSPHIEGAEAIDPDLLALDAAARRRPALARPRVEPPERLRPRRPVRATRARPDTGPGLTAAGTRLVRRCHELGIAVDLSHLNEAGFWDVARLERAPLIASHSGAHALCPARRNLTDAQLDAISASGGLVGVVFAVAFVRADGARGPGHAAGGDRRPRPPRRRPHRRRSTSRSARTSTARRSRPRSATSPACHACWTPSRATGFTAGEIEAIAWGNWRRVLEAPGPPSPARPPRPPTPGEPHDHRGGRRHVLHARPTRARSGTRGRR